MPSACPVSPRRAVPATSPAVAMAPPSLPAAPPRSRRSRAHARSTVDRGPAPRAAGPRGLGPRSRQRRPRARSTMDRWTATPSPGPQHSAVDRPLPSRHVAEPASTPARPCRFAKRPLPFFKINPRPG
ncbi:predicted GPI-anchored protein 58 [Sorghum bicolor]|uniref:predicted GPI-anchored protein 58 n=1 Tax=Sorghum bicolor TaxID=4558 RepID=UPI000B424323|nr:predicted GPI-anchored protein 58 [Sorghum bicolor]|eukprot:XP_021315124.1 predicted GPI-anchored protein 58 [Sorghum bicolor]